jgi:lysophospholipase L1-like esterase
MSSEASVVAAPSAGIRGWIRTMLVLGVFGFVCLIGGELFARLDDWWFADVPFLSTPSYNDLFMEDELGRRGKPHAHFEKWRMNNFGFRSPETMTQAPDPSTVRVALLGASETFGLYESPNHEYAAQLAKLVAPRNLEIVNTGLPGITLHTLSDYWNNWVVTFRPQVAVVYPSTHLYMTCEDDLPQQDAPKAPRAPPPQKPKPFSVSIGDLRLVARAKNVVELPDRVVEWRNERKILAVTSQHSASWLYSKPPQLCVDAFRADLEQLIDNVQRAGTRLVLATQATSAAVTPDSAGLRDLESFRAFSPRAPALVLRQFIAQSNDAVRSVAAERRLPLVDVDAALSGQRENFGDLVHFNDAGAARMARLLEAPLTGIAGELKVASR